MAIITTTRVFTRQNNQTVWFWKAYPEEQKAFMEYQDKNYVQTGKLLERTSTAKELINTTAIKWASAAAMNEFFNDPVVVEFHAFRKTYDDRHSITDRLIVG